MDKVNAITDSGTKKGEFVPNHRQKSNSGTKKGRFVPNQRQKSHQIIIRAFMANILKPAMVRCLSGSLQLCREDNSYIFQA